MSGHTHVRYTHADRNFANQTHTGSEETMNVNTQHFVANPLSSTMSLPAARPGTSHPWPDVCHKWDFCRDGWTDRTVFFAREFLSTHPTLYFKEIRVSPKLMVLPSGTLTQTLDLENFATAYRSSKCVIDLGGSS